MLNDVIRTTLAQFVDRVRSFAPNVLAMLAVLLVGVLVAGAARIGLDFLLPRLGVDRFAERSGIGDVARRAGLTRRPSRNIALAAAWVVLAVFMLLAVAALDVQVAVDLVTRTFAWLPHLLVAFALLLAGGLVAGFVRRSVLIAAVNAGLPSARLLSSGAHAALLVLFSAMALEEVGLGQRVVLTAFAISFGGVVLALALAFGLAGKELARESLERLLRRRGAEDEDGLKHL
jgi:mechanosensitive ion channel-like protein